MFFRRIVPDSVQHQCFAVVTAAPVEELAALVLEAEVCSVAASQGCMA